MRDKFAFYVVLSKISPERKNEQIIEILNTIKDVAQTQRILLNPSSLLTANIIMICKEKGVPTKIYGFTDINEPACNYLKTVYPIFGRTRYKNFIKHLKNPYEY